MAKTKSTKTKTTPTLWNKLVADYIKKTGKLIPKKGTKDYKALKANYEAAKKKTGGNWSGYAKRRSEGIRRQNEAQRAVQAATGAGSLYSTYV